MKLLDPVRSPITATWQCQDASSQVLYGSSSGGGRSRLTANCSTDTWTRSWPPAGGKGIVRDMIRVLTFQSPASQILHEALLEVCLLQQGLQDGSSTLIQWGYPAPTSSPPYLQAPNSGCHTTHSDRIGSDVIQKLTEAALGGGKRGSVVSSCTPLSFSTLRTLKQPPTFYTTPVQS